MNRPMGALGQMAATKLRAPKQPAPLDLSGVDQNLARSGNMLRKGISRMRQMNRGGKVSSLKGIKGLKNLRAKRNQAKVEAETRANTALGDDLKTMADTINQMESEAIARGVKPNSQPWKNSPKPKVQKLQMSPGDQVNFFDDSGGGWIRGTIKSLDKVNNEALVVSPKGWEMLIDTRIGWDPNSNSWTNRPKK